MHLCEGGVEHRVAPHKKYGEGPRDLPCPPDRGALQCPGEALGVAEEALVQGALHQDPDPGRCAWIGPGSRHPGRHQEALRREGRILSRGPVSGFRAAPGKRLVGQHRKEGRAA